MEFAENGNILVSYYSYSMCRWLTEKGQGSKDKTNAILKSTGKQLMGTNNMVDIRVVLSAVSST